MVIFKIGIIAIQGDVSEHVQTMEKALNDLGSVIPIKQVGIVPECSGLVLPGGESTTLSKQLNKTGIDNELKAAASAGVPVLATCAGLVLASKEVVGDVRIRPLGLIDITVSRNAFGPQRESFEADLDVEGFDTPYRAAFIRAPAIVKTGAGVQILAKADSRIVAARQRNVFCLAFHPELTDDMRFHKLFLEMAEVAGNEF